MDEECTVPFIARYRKEATGAWTSARFDAWRIDRRAGQLEQRRDAILAALEFRDLNRGESRRLGGHPNEARGSYLPHRPKRATRASAALDLGLGPLADDLLDPSTSYSRGLSEGSSRRPASPTQTRRCGARGTSSRRKPGSASRRGKREARVLARAG